MKTKKILAACIILCGSFSLLSAKEKFMGFVSGLSAGLPVYGSDSTKQMKDSIENPFRLVPGIFFFLNIAPVEQVSFYGGVDLLFDFDFNSDNYMNSIAIDFPIGIKIYPGLEGFNFGLSYVLAARADFYDLENGSQGQSGSAWGNGTKFSIEYNFAHASKTHSELPLIGLSWKVLPRGNKEYDNYISAYLGFNL